MPRTSTSEILTTQAFDPADERRLEVVRIVTDPGPEPVLPTMPDPDPERRAKLYRLERHLWESANILRGKFDSSDYKNYILDLLFFKRVSDVSEEEEEKRLAGTWDPDVDGIDQIRLVVPVRWKEIRGDGTGVGVRINEALRALDEANPSLEGVFQNADFANQKRLSDATLVLLVDHFEKYPLGIAEVPPDLFGAAYLFLIAHFAENAGKKGGEFFTPSEVVRLIVELLRPEEGMSVYDPACGSGGMLLEAAKHLRRYHEEPRSLRLFGQEMNLETWRICKLTLVVHGIGDAQVDCGDTLRDPAQTIGDGVLKRFDRVLANPPFSLKSWGHETWRNGDPYGRDLYGCPPPSYGDLAFVQHMLASLDARGMLGVVVPHGVLFRGGAEGRIRRGLLEDDLVEALIGLAPNLFYGTAIPACVMVINRAKRPARRGKVLFVDASREVQAGKNKSYLADKDVRRLAETFHEFRDEPHFARVADLDAIAGHDFILTISRYVTPPDEDEAPVDVARELRQLRRLRAERRAADEQMESFLEELGYEIDPA